MGRNRGEKFSVPVLERRGLVAEDDAGEVQVRFVVAMFACPAFAITAIGLDPAAASFVIAVCRRSWNGRT